MSRSYKIGKYSVGGNSYPLYKDDENYKFVKLWNDQVVTVYDESGWKDKAVVKDEITEALKVPYQSYADYRREMAAISGRY